jgi:hypothetical protein
MDKKLFGFSNVPPLKQQVAPTIPCKIEENAFIFLPG